MTQKTAWYMLTRIRAEMASQEDAFLQGIIEADETYIGDKPRRRNGGEETPQPPKRGRGTNKTSVIGVVERGGKVIARPTDNLRGKTILEFINENVNSDGSILMTDEFQSYKVIDPIMPHEVINHSERQYVDDSRFTDGGVHTNTIEGFWALVKRAWYGSHHHYSKKYLGLYVAEACFKYNNRTNEEVFFDFMSQLLRGDHLDV